MLQIEHIYEFFYGNLFKKFSVVTTPSGVLPDKFVGFPGLPQYVQKKILENRNNKDYLHNIIFFYDQEPMHVDKLVPYVNDIIDTSLNAQLTITVSEISQNVDSWREKNINVLYYFFHGFAALDWFRGHRALNYSKNPIKNYKYDYQSFNRIVTGDRAYRKIFVTKLKENNLLDNGLVSYGVTNEPVTDERLVIDQEQISATASADILRSLDCPGQPDYSAFWHIVTETVFYYDKLHLTEKIFKPIVSKQPFMLLAAPGNLAYLKSYGFKTFDSVIDESYDLIQDDHERIDAVVTQIKWYCNLSQEEKSRVIERLAPIVEYNFHHFYGKFKEIITDELLDNSKKLFKELNYDDSDVDYALIKTLLTS